MCVLAFEPNRTQQNTHTNAHAFFSLSLMLSCDWCSRRRGKSRDPRDEATRGDGKHDPCPMYRPHPPQLLRGPDARYVSVIGAWRSAGDARGLVLISSLLVWIILQVSFSSLGLLRRGSVLPRTARYSILRYKISGDLCVFSASI